MLTVNIGKPEKIIIFYDSKYWDSEKINYFIVSQSKQYTRCGGGGGGEGGGGAGKFDKQSLGKKKKIVFLHDTSSCTMHMLIISVQYVQSI